MKHVFTLMGVWFALCSFAQSALVPASFIHAENPMLLSQINQDQTGDSYPYLSADGLRLYFIQGKSIPDNQLFMASRTSTDKPFADAHTVSPMIPWGVMSVWLNADETQLYFVQDKQLYFCSRTSKQTDFNFPVPVTLSGVEGFISAPSFTPDMQELYLYHNQQPVEKGIYRLKKTGEQEYTLVGDFNPPAHTLTGPGQLSKNGLAYYFELNGEGANKIYKTTRKSLAAEWENPSEVTGLGHDSTNCLQPTVSADERSIVYVTNLTGVWAGNDLTCARLPESSIPVTALPQAVSASALSVTDAPVSSVQLRAYPNPTDTKLVLDWNGIETGAYFTLLDIHGRELLRRTVYETQTTLDLSPYPGGIYFVAWSQNNSGGSLKVVKQ